MFEILVGQHFRTLGGSAQPVVAALPSRQGRPMMKNHTFSVIFAHFLMKKLNFGLGCHFQALKMVGMGPKHHTGWAGWPTEFFPVLAKSSTPDRGLIAARCYLYGSQYDCCLVSDHSLNGAQE